MHDTHSVNMKQNSANCNATLDDSPGTSLNVSNSSMLTVVTGLACIGLISFTIVCYTDVFLYYYTPERTVDRTGGGEIIPLPSSVGQ